MCRRVAPSSAVPDFTAHVTLSNLSGVNILSYNHIYGAGLEDWAAAVALFGDAILPSVCAPNIPMSENSNLASYYKTPSVISRNGTAYGIKAWQSLKATQADVKLWSSDDRHGICACTRSIQAIDIDTTSAELASRVVEYFALNIGADIPLRVGNAGRGTLFLRVEAPDGIAKSVMHLKDHGGNIEFLGTRQQSMLVGTHKSGVKYYWPDGFPTSVPIIKLQDFADLWNDLAAHIGETEDGEYQTLTLEGLNERAAGSVLDSKDPFVAVLYESGTVMRTTKDKVFIECPWADQHTERGGKYDEAAYLPATTTHPANYRCLHSHCKNKNITDLHAHYEYAADDFGDVHLAAPSNEVQHWHSDPKWVWAKRKGSDEMVVADNVLNIRVALKYPELCGGRQFRRDMFRAQPDMKPSKEGKDEWGAIDDEAITLISNDLKDRTIGGFTIDTSDAIVDKQINAYLADKAFDSALDLVASLPKWDGVERVSRLAPDVMRTADTEYNRDMGTYLLLTLALRLANQKPTDVQGILILVGGQFAGKSHFIKHLCPFDKTQTLQLSNDLTKMRRRAMGRSVIHLEEMAGFKTAGDENIKSFISDATDAWRRNYTEYDEEVTRRFILVGSTNKDDLLKDTTGNRRWFPVHVCEGLDPKVQMNTGLFVKNRAQYLAEALHMLGEKGNSVVRALYAKHQRSEEAEDARRKIVAASIHHDRIQDAMKHLHGEELEITAAKMHTSLALKADPSHTSLRDIALSFVRLGCECVDQATMKYKNIFYNSLE